MHFRRQHEKKQAIPASSRSILLTAKNWLAKLRSLASASVKWSLMKSMRNSSKKSKYAMHPITKRKGYSQNESPYVKTKAWAIVLLCTRPSEWVHFLYAVFSRILGPGMAAKETCQNHSYSRVHLPFCIRFLQEHKEKDWNLVSKFQSFYGGAKGTRTPDLNTASVAY